MIFSNFYKTQTIYFFTLLIIKYLCFVKLFFGSFEHLLIIYVYFAVELIKQH